MGRRRWGWVVLAVALGCASSTAVGAPTSESVHVTAVGDYSTSSGTSSVLNGIAAAAPDANFALGDLSYGTTGAEQAWCDYVKARVGEGFPFELLAGNHESNGQNGNINDFSACLPNQLPGLVGTYGRQYYVDVPQVDPLVRYVMISPSLPFPDGTWSYNAGTPRYEWTRAAIDQARARNIPWVVVGMHKPCLSRGVYACDPGPDIVNLLVNRKVDLVLSGHEHHYERTKQIAHGTGCSTLAIGTYDADCVVDSDDSLQAGAGTVFMTIGTGGVTLRDLDAGDPEAGYFASGTGANTTATFGFSDFRATPDRMDVSFVRTAGGAYSDAFSLVRGAAPPNTPPTAAFTATPSGLSVGLDASASGDSDGSITSYAWTFGDGTSGSGVTTQHTYAVAGTYPVTLTVTDDDGATTTLTKDVTVTSGGVVTLASDDFARTVTNGWGTADSGGSWSRTGLTGETTVGEGVGRLTMSAAGRGPSASLTSVSSTDTEVSFDVAFSKRPSSRADTNVFMRRSSGGSYAAWVKLMANGSVRASLVRAVTGGASTTLAGELTVPGLTYDVGDVLKVRSQAVGTSPTQLRMKVWEAGTPEPSTWTLTAQDSTAALQSNGWIGFAAYLSGNDTAAPVTAAFDTVRAVRTGTLP
jgi:PKD repeat protein